MDVSVEIGELVLTGVGPIDRDQFVAAFERELTRLVTERGVDAEPRELDIAQGTPLRHSTSSRRLGKALARSIHSGLSRGAP